MGVPTFTNVMRPFLVLLQDGLEKSIRDITRDLAAHYALTAEELDVRVSSGQPQFANRVAWAKTYLKKAGLIENTRRGICRITDLGRKALQHRDSPFDLAFLEQFDEFRDFRYGDPGNPLVLPDQRERTGGQWDMDLVETPDEVIDRLVEQSTQALVDELLDVIKSCTPGFFERLVVKLLVQMGYGGTEQETAAQVVGRSGDGGIDGVIKQDPLGLDNVYIQAKRWEGSVGSPEIQKFVGALAGRRATKGVFITTSNFTASARDYAHATAGFTVVLVCGEELATLMIQHDVGVAVKSVKVMKRIDNDFFLEE